MLLALSSLSSLEEFDLLSSTWPQRTLTQQRMSTHLMDKTRQRFSDGVTIDFSLDPRHVSIEDNLICWSDLSPSFCSSDQTTKYTTTHNNCWSELTITIWHISSMWLKFADQTYHPLWSCRFWSADQWTCTHNQTTAVWTDHRIFACHMPIHDIYDLLIRLYLSPWPSRFWSADQLNLLFEAISVRGQRQIVAKWWSELRW